MKAKTMMYAGLGFATLKIGKLLSKRQVRGAIRDWKAGRDAHNR